MIRILTSQVKSKVGEEVKLQGNLHKVRKLGGLTFGVVRDRGGIIQIITEDKDSVLARLKRESIIEVIGIVKEQEKAPNGFEIVISNIEVISEVNEDLPFEIDKNEINANIDTLLNHRGISLRNLKNKAIFKVQASILKAYRDFLTEKGFTEVNTSKIVANATEGGSEVFEIKYFDRKAYLAQSPQFYKQMTMGVFERVFETNFVYRAEPHNTSRHINEYLSLDAEFGYIDSFYDIINLENEMLVYIIDYVRKINKEDLKFFDADLPKVPSDNKMPIIKFRDAQKILEENYNQDCKGLVDLEPEHEKLLCAYVLEKFGSDFVFITHYPTVKRPMYTMPDSEDPEHTCSFDLLCRGLEVTTGGQRIHNYEMLCSNIEKWGNKVSDFEDYLEPFKYGMPKHGGWGMGLERITGRFLGLSNVKESTILPRDVDRLNP